MATIADVKQWISELLPHGRAYERYVQVIKDEGEGNMDGVYKHEFIAHIFTKSRHYYHIVAKDENDNTGYLGCQAGTSYHLAGEDHTRGNDLPDGPLSEETWNKIVCAIIAYELRELGT